MNRFEVPVFELEVLEPHPFSAQHDVAYVGKLTCVVEKGKFQPRDLVVHVPVDSVYAGQEVHKIDIEGVPSYGLLLPSKLDWPLGADVKELLHIQRLQRSS